MRKERLSIGLDAPTISWIRREAKKAGLTIGEYLRRLIDEARAGK